MARAHQADVLHRDLKPENVLITREHTVKIMDLGVAHLQDEGIRLSQTGQFVASILYAPPEAFRATGDDQDGRVDLFSLGVLLYELATGQYPYRHADIAVVLERVLNKDPRRVGDVNPQLSPFFEEVIHTLIQKDRERRSRSAADLLHVLDAGETGTWWQTLSSTIRRDAHRQLRRSASRAKRRSKAARPTSRRGELPTTRSRVDHGPGHSGPDPRASSASRADLSVRLPGSPRAASGVRGSTPCGSPRAKSMVGRAPVSVRWGGGPSRPCLGECQRWRSVAGMGALEVRWHPWYERDAPGA